MAEGLLETDRHRKAAQTTSGVAVARYHSGHQQAEICAAPCAPADRWEGECRGDQEMNPVKELHVLLAYLI